jgi:beta-fructofuranosidase
MNDPNGPIFFRGRYHMFFQYNPQSAVWGSISWNHAVSRDMIHWEHLPLAFTPSSDGPDAAGCFSGSTFAVADAGRQRVYALYTGVVKDKGNETIRNEGLRESQCLAWSDDPDLRVWHKRKDPVVSAPPKGLAITGFRDPCVWKHGDTYLMVIGSGIQSVGGCALLYESRDLTKWTYLHFLTAGSWNGLPTSNPVNDGEMWECPDFFALDGGYVLIYSSQRRVFWQSGVLDERTLRFTALHGGILDIGAFYAPKTQLDASGRRILWGWVPEKRSNEEMLRAGWSGMFSLPRLLTLSQDGTLHIRALPELSGLRDIPLLPATGSSSSHGTLTLPSASGEALCTGRRGAPFTLTVDVAGATLLTAYYLPDTHTFRMGEQHVSLPADAVPSLHLFLDGSVMEIFLGGVSAYTQRFYYEANTAPECVLSVDGIVDTVQGWSLKPISNDRMTSQPTAAGA